MFFLFLNKIYCNGQICRITFLSVRRIRFSDMLLAIFWCTYSDASDEMAHHTKGWMKIIGGFLFRNDPRSIKRSTMTTWSNSSSAFNLPSNRFQVVRDHCCPNVIAGLCVPSVVTWTDSRKTPNLWWPGVIEHLRNPSLFYTLYDRSPSANSCPEQWTFKWTLTFNLADYRKS